MAARCFELRLRGETCGLHDARSAWYLIQREFEMLADQYAGVVRWELIDTETGDLYRSPRQAGMWAACCETAGVFALWLDMVAPDRVGG
jgi:hypothetical protein